MPPELKEYLKSAISEVRKDRQKFFDEIKNDIEKAIALINKYDKLYVLGGFGARLIKTLPTFYNQYLEEYKGADKREYEQDLVQDDEEIEVLLEYLMSIASAFPNNADGVIPTKDEIEEIYKQLSKIKANINFWELSADIPMDGNESDHWLRTVIMSEETNVRGDAFLTHMRELFSEVFDSHNGFLIKYYGFDANDVFEAVAKLDNLVYSKVGNLFGSVQSHTRFVEWSEETPKEQIEKRMAETGEHFISQFLEANPDLLDMDAPEKITSYHLDLVDSYNKMFWVIPKTDKEKIIFQRLSIEFGDNDVFLQPPKFKAFPLNDSLIKLKPLIKHDGKYYHFSLTLPFRSIFKIVEQLLMDADMVYYEQYFRGNNNPKSRDNYIEHKTKELFQIFLPSTKFYSSLEYEIVENDQYKKTELDILGISDDSIYIIEVKAGVLNKKHRRGAMKGLKDRLNETINEGSYQCQRALNYINIESNPEFIYKDVNSQKTLTIDKSKIKSYFKISVTLEHFSAIAANLKYLINSGVLSPEFKWSWIVSIYDLMVFADLIEGESDFQEYLRHRLELYDNEDVQFVDEIDILGFYLDGNFPISEEFKDKKLFIGNSRDRIEQYYRKIGVGMPDIEKPRKKGSQ